MAHKLWESESRTIAQILYDWTEGQNPNTMAHMSWESETHAFAQILIDTNLPPPPSIKGGWGRFGGTGRRVRTPTQWQKFLLTPISPPSTTEAGANLPPPNQLQSEGKVLGGGGGLCQ